MGYLILALCIVATPADAGPVIAAFFTGLGISGTASAGAALAAGVFGGAAAFAYSAGLFLTSTIGSVLLNAGIAALSGKSRTPTPTVEDAKINVLLDVQSRWQMGGTAAVGGAVGIFAEFENSGVFWYIVAHGDAELTNTPQYYLDGIAVTLATVNAGIEVIGDVLTNDFCVTPTWGQYAGTGTKTPCFRIFTITPSVGNAYGAKPAAFTTAFPSLPANFFLTGVTYTIVRCVAVPQQHYSTVFKWRGRFGLGEPTVVMVGNFNRMYDPRNGAHNINNPDTWTASVGNPAIVWAWWRTHKFGRNRPMSQVNWTKVTEQANLCDATVLNRLGVPIPRYRCGFAFPDNKPRAECEAEILASADAFVVYDDTGLAWPRVGTYEAPTLTFTAARDIMTAHTDTIDPTDTPVDGVVVNYISPAHGYSKQAAAPWQNLNWYNAANLPNYLNIDILTCQDHNQAVRLAKAIGQRLAPIRRAAYGTNIKGILARGIRTVTIDHDAQFQGVHEIVTPVDIDPSGQAVTFSVVPIATDRWDLGIGEEGAPPPVDPDLALDGTIIAPINVVITSDGTQFRATFDAPARTDRAFRFRYVISPYTAANLQLFTVDMVKLTAWSGPVTNQGSYQISWQAITLAGREGAWSSPLTIVAVNNSTAPAALLSASATGGVGQAVVSFTTANDVNQAAIAIWRGATNVFAAATQVHTVYAGPNFTGTDTETALAVGVWYYWAQPLNNSNVAGIKSGPFLVTVT